MNPARVNTIKKKVKKSVILSLYIRKWFASINIYFALYVTRPHIYLYKYLYHLCRRTLGFFFFLFFLQWTIVLCFWYCRIKRCFQKVNSKSRGISEKWQHKKTRKYNPSYTLAGTTGQTPWTKMNKYINKLSQFFSVSTKRDLLFFFKQETIPQATDNAWIAMLTPVWCGPVIIRIFPELSEILLCVVSLQNVSDRGSPLHRISCNS